MQSQSYCPQGLLDGSDVGVQSTADGQDILLRQRDIGQSLACLLGRGKAVSIRCTSTQNISLKSPKPVFALYKPNREQNFADDIALP